MKLIILDRDGVINYESRAYIKSPDEWIPIPGSIEAIAELTAAGYTIVVATNQSGVARGYINLSILETIHAKLLNEVEKHQGKINKIYFCPHGPHDGCNCRKPKPGMFEQIATDLQVVLSDLPAIFVGDSLRDVELGLATGCKFFLVTGPGGDGAETLELLSTAQRQQITIVDDLADATSRLLYA